MENTQKIIAKRTQQSIQAVLFANFMCLGLFAFWTFFSIAEINNKLENVRSCIVALVEEGVKERNMLAQEHNKTIECVKNLEAEIDTIWNHHYALYKITEELHGGKHE